MTIADAIPGWRQRPRQEADDVGPEMRRATEVMGQNEERMMLGEQFMIGDSQEVIRMKNGGVFGPAEGGNAFVVMKNTNPRNGGTGPNANAGRGQAMENQNPWIPNYGIQERTPEGEQRRGDIGERQRLNLQQQQRGMQDRREKRPEGRKAEIQRERNRVKEERDAELAQEAQAEQAFLGGLFPARVKSERDNHDWW